MNVQSCFMSTFISINVARLFHPANPQNAKKYNFDKIMQKREIIFVYLPNTSQFLHFQSVRQKKWNNHNKTNKYRWHFRSNPHKTTSLAFVCVYILTCCRFLPMKCSYTYGIHCTYSLNLVWQIRLPWGFGNIQSEMHSTPPQNGHPLAEHGCYFGHHRGWE